MVKCRKCYIGKAYVQKIRPPTTRHKRRNPRQWAETPLRRLREFCGLPGCRGRIVGVVASGQNTKGVNQLQVTPFGAVFTLRYCLLRLTPTTAIWKRAMHKPRTHPNGIKERAGLTFPPTAVLGCQCQTGDNESSTGCPGLSSGEKARHPDKPAPRSLGRLLVLVAVAIIDRGMGSIEHFGEWLA